ncbi:GNAT family N-acetyltransferase [candidate division KSB1 bacterium]|nr:GNAT family N-acetyltransferase [candidate division KSB1 bacterium]
MEFKLSYSLLRPWQRSDEASLAQHANNRNVWRNLRDAFPHPYTMNDAEQWIQKASAEDPVMDFAIVVQGAAVGGIGLIPRADVHRHTLGLGYWLGEAFWGRGIMTEAVCAVTDYAFQNAETQRVYACVYAWNPGSTRVLEKAGYQLEGRLRKHARKDGMFVDEFIYGILREERQRPNDRQAI